MYVYNVYIHIYIYMATCATMYAATSPGEILLRPWLRTNGVNTNGAAAKVMNLPDWGKGTPWHFWEYKTRSRGVANKT